MARSPHRRFGLCVAALVAAGQCAGVELRDLHYGEALYEADQGRFFDALVRLDTELAQHYGLDEPALDTLHYHVNGAEFSVGDFELNYRMHNRAGRAIRAVLEGNVDAPVRNEAAFRLAEHRRARELADRLLRGHDDRRPDHASVGDAVRGLPARGDARLPVAARVELDVGPGEIVLAELLLIQRPPIAGFARTVARREQFVGDSNCLVVFLQVGQRTNFAEQRDRVARHQIERSLVER